MQSTATPARMKKRFPLSFVSMLFLCTLYLELLLRLSCSLPVIHDGLPGALLLDLSIACALAVLCTLPRKSRQAFVVCILLMELITIWYLIAYFTDDSYGVFMSPAIIARETRNVVKDFGGSVLTAALNGLGVILLYHVPVIVALVFRRQLLFPPVLLRYALPAALILTLASAFGAYGLSNITPQLKTEYQQRYTYDNAVRNFGLFSAFHQELAHKIFPKEVNYQFEPLPTASAQPSSTPLPSPMPTQAPAHTPLPSPEMTAAPVGPNIMELDFSKAAGSDQVGSLSAYIQSRAPTEKNAYTGLFSGKNLILISAESFSKELIDPDLTPALYRMANKGIVFEDFYQPAWGGSTSTGEYSWLTGLAPTDPLTMMLSYDKNLYFTMGNQLQRLGYFSRAYHNGSYDYYNRNMTHENLGYAKFIAVGNGLEEGLTAGEFPHSDKEMFEYTLPQYINNQPFSVYYMTISGHPSYGFSSDTNDMAMKNRAVTENLPHSTTVNAYIACNLELEYAMEDLLQSLEDAGIADDTVVVLVPDHYPYGLSPSAAWGDSGNALAELFGYLADTPWKRDHNAAIIWCGTLEKSDEPVRVSGPVSSLDILPTLSNLFGLEYDSRLLPGNDVFSDAERLVFWNDYSWITEKGTYNAHGDRFTPADGQDADRDYLDRIHADVRNKINLSWTISYFDYYGLLFGEDNIR